MYQWILSINTKATHSNIFNTSENGWPEMETTWKTVFFLSENMSDLTVLLLSLSFVLGCCCFFKFWNKVLQLLYMFYFILEYFCNKIGHIKIEQEEIMRKNCYYRNEVNWKIKKRLNKNCNRFSLLFYQGTKTNVHKKQNSKYYILIFSTSPVTTIFFINVVILVWYFIMFIFIALECV